MRASLRARLVTTSSFGPPCGGEVALAKALHKTYRALGDDRWPDALVEFCEKMEGLSND